MDPSTSSGRSLIERLEAATEGSRELDAEIASGAGWKCTGAYRSTFRALVAVPPSGRGVKTVPRYTTSIDAALTLVPEGWASDIWLKRYNGHHWEAALHRPSRECYGRSKSPALALVIAALKARERQ